MLPLASEEAAASRPFSPFSLTIVRLSVTEPIDNEGQRESAYEGKNDGVK